MEGAKRALSRSVRPFVVLPALASLVVVGGGMYWVFGHVAGVSAAIGSLLPNWLDFLNVVIEPLLYIISVLIGAWLFGFMAMIIGSPFLGELSLRVDTLVAEPTPWWQQIVPTLLREGRKLVYQLPRLLGLILITITPIVNALSPILWITYGAWMMAVHFCDYAFENRGRPFTDTLATLRKYRIAVMGFGACATIGMSIPLLNFTIAPIAVVGATLMMQQIFAEEEQGSAGLVRQ